MNTKTKKSRWFTVITALCLVVAALFMVTGCSSNVNNDNDDTQGIDMSQIDFSNIDNLYKQPLPVIQKCVQGKWKWVINQDWGDYLTWLVRYTFVEIDENRVIITQDEPDPRWSTIYPRTFSYSWRKMETSSGRMDYVMWDNEKNADDSYRGDWYFDSIKNDTLIAHHDCYLGPNFFHKDYLVFERIK